jgi:protein gp37
MSKRLAGRFGYPKDNPFAVTLHLDKDKLDEPLIWKKSSRVFVCSMGDLFHDEVDFSFIRAVWARMTTARQHIYMVLTKRPERMKKFFEWMELQDFKVETSWPNIWLGVTAENQARADERIPILLQIPAAVRFVSVEPMLSNINVSRYLKWPLCKSWLSDGNPDEYGKYQWVKQSLVGQGWVGLDQVICGGETGPGARPMHPDWARSLRDQCQAAGTPFFFKSWGNWLVPFDGDQACRVCGCTNLNGCDEGCYWIEGDLCSSCIDKSTPAGDRPVKFRRIGKKAPGRLLDGVEWSEYPEVRVND